MTGLKSYVLGVTATAVICAMVNSFFNKNSVYSSLLKLLSGIIMIIAIAAPWQDIQLPKLTDFTNHISSEAAYAADIGRESYEKELREIIKAKTESYILDKAVSMGIHIEVEVTLDDSNPPLPQQVMVKGAVSPYSKEKMSQYIREELAISKDDLIWI